MKINEIVKLILLTSLLLFFGCENVLESDLNDTEISRSITNTDGELADIKAYEGLTFSEVTSNYYIATFNEKKTILEAMDIAEEYSLKPSHLHYTGIDNETNDIINGMLRLSDGAETLESEIVNNLSEFSNIEYTGFSIVYIEPEVTKSINSSMGSEEFSLTKIENESNDDTEDKPSKLYSEYTLDPWLPNKYGISLSVVNTSFHSETRRIVWVGTWTEQYRLDNFQTGSSPAFEPDIKLETGGFFRRESWAEKDPRFNAYKAYSNMPNAYVDTQAGDGEYKSWTIGSTAVEKFILNKQYYFKLLCAPGHDRNAQKGLGFKFEQWKTSGGAGGENTEEGHPWTVGTWQSTDKAEIYIFEEGSKQVPFNYSYSEPEPEPEPEPIIIKSYGDFNGDGISDLIQIENSIISVGISNSVGQFISWNYTLPVGHQNGIYDYSLADFNGDGRTDIIQIANSASWIGITDSNGQFQYWSHTVNTGRYGTNYEYFFADFNGDGRDDMIQIADNSSWIGLADSNGNIEVWSDNINTGRFGSSYQHLFEDVNGDGKDDLIQIGDNSSWIGLSDNNGHINIWTHTINTGRYGENFHHQFEDVNGDGRKDLIQIGSNNIWVGIADINGNIDIWTYSLPVGEQGGVYEYHFADFNGDGRTDIIQIANSASWIGIADSSGQFQYWSHSVNTGRFGTNYHHYFEDINNDGREDMIQTRDSDNYRWIGLADLTGNINIWSY